MSVPLSNLAESTLFNYVPSGVRAQDANGIIQAVIGAYQDQYDDLRAAGSDIANLWSATGNVGFPHPVILYTYTSDTGQTIPVELEIESDTPPTAGANLLTWAAGQAGIDPSLSISAIYATSTNRTALIQTAQFLADTLGVQFVEPIEPSTDRNLYLQKVLAGYFSRLKIKGTATSFEVAGRLIGFADTAYIPLWGRLSPRYPSEPGNSQNLPDFSIQPEIFPVAELPDPIYDPTVTNDGTLYTWTSPAVTLNPAAANYAPNLVNGFSPFISIQVTDATQTTPLAGSYFLNNGGPLTPAELQLNSSLLVLALASGTSFNGMQVVITSVTASTFTLSVTYNLSAIKFKTSLFDLIGGLETDYYGATYVEAASTNSDLLDNPYLYFASGSEYFVNSGVAIAPFRAWKAGSVTPPTVVTWPNLSVTPSYGPIVPRTEALPTDTEMDLTVLKNSAQSLLQICETVKPAIDDLRTLGVGLVTFDTIQYAAYQNSVLLFSRQAPSFDGLNESFDSDQYSMDNVNGTAGSISGTLPDDGLSYPDTEFTGEFYYIVQNGPTLAIGQTTDLTTPGNVILLLNSTEPQITLVGSYNFNTQYFQFVVSGAPGNIQAIWTTTGQDVIRSVPPYSAFLAGTISFQQFPEDELDSTGWLSYADDAPWLRIITGLGTEDSHDVTVESISEETIEGGRWMTAIDETSNTVSLVALESDQLVPRVLVAPIDASLRSQYCVGTRAIIGWTCDASFPASDTIHNSDSSGFSGILNYHVSSLRKNLVADINAHWLEDVQQAGLVNWLRLAEHPNAPWALTSTEYVLTNVQGSYDITSRVWTEDRGWALQLLNQNATWQMQHDLVIGGTLAFWVNPGDGQDQLVPFTCDISKFNCSSSTEVNTSYIEETGLLPSGPGINVASFGPMSVWLNGTQATAYVTTDTGVNQLVGQLTLFPDEFNLICLSGTPVDTENTPTAAVAAVINVVATGTQIIDGIQLIPGMTALLTNQADPRGNGHYVVEVGNWNRVPYDWPEYPLVLVEGGSNAGIWQLETTSVIGTATFDSNTISMDAEVTLDVNTTYTGGAVYWRKINSTWLFGCGTLSEPMVYDAVTAYPSCNQATFTYPTATGSISAGAQQLVFSDWRVWNQPKTQDQIDEIRSPRFTQSQVAWPQWSIPGSRGSERYPLSVVPAGYAYPSLASSQCQFNLPKWTVRYDSLGRYVGPEWKRKESLGNGPALGIVVPTLGNNADNFRLGQFGVASSTGDGGVVGEAWSQSNTPGQILQLNNQWPLPATDSYTYEVASPWPQPIPENTSARQTVWVNGDDGFVYAVTVDDGPQTAALVATLIPNKRNAGELAAIIPQILDLEIIDVPGDAVSLGGDGTNCLQVLSNGGNPMVVNSPSSLVNVPLAMYTFGRRLQTLQLNDPNVALNPQIWTNINTAGEAIGAAMLNQAGTMVFSFSGQLQPGAYNLLLQVGNDGQLDAGFEGYDFEITVDNDNPIVATTLLPNGPGYLSYTWGGSSTSLILPDMLASDLGSALNSLQSIIDAGGVTVSGNFGGPYTVTWNEPGYQDPIVVTATGTSANVIVTVAGDFNDAAVQVVSVVRQTFTVPLEVLQATQATWTLTFTYTNALALPQYGQIRAPVLFTLNFYDSNAKLWQVNTTPVSLTQLSTSVYSPTVPGAWRRTIYPDGTVLNSHEVTLPVTSNYGETDIPSQPVGGLLTGSTVDKDSHIDTLGVPVLGANVNENLDQTFAAMIPQAQLQT